ncbi:MAG TPA: ATP-dependent helicase [Acidimicrobiales bacterium]|nr:ATP-dependent helicase [Acidimicrobiales bacterium]
MDGDQSSALLRGLTAAQRAAVISDAAPLCVLAGAGSGKTTVLTRRVARRIFDGSASAEHSLVLTFTRKASRELRERLWHLQTPGRVWAGTFHAAAYGQLRRHWSDAGLRPLGLLDDPGRLLRRTGRPGTEPLSGETARAVLAEIQWAQARLVSPETYAAAASAGARRTPLPVEETAEAFRRYEQAKRSHGLIDLNDLLIRCAELIEHDPAVAAACHWRIRHLYVDEFQDLNPAQWRLLTAWLGPRSDLFVVGDPRQAVYGWNGADPTLLDRLPDLLAGTRVLRLDANHRSSPQVIAAARAVLRSSGLASSAREPTLEPSGPVGEGAGGIGSAGRPDGPVPEVSGFADEAEEANALARWLRRMHRPGRPWSHLAVLARTNSRLTPIAAGLDRAGIPFRIGPSRAGEEMKAVMDLLRSDTLGRPLRSALADLSLPGIPPVLARLADEHAVEEPGASVGGFLSWLSATVADGTTSETDPAADVVELSTFHRAKGLEWPAVALIGLEDGLVPISYADTPAARSEEHRLLYVAITRAEERLWCSWSGQRQAGDRVRASRPSPLLAAIEAAGRPAPSTADAESFAAQMAALRRRLPAATPA